MKCLIAGYEGAEEVLQDEIKEKLKLSSKKEASVAIFEAKDMKDYAKLAYLGQSFTLIMELLGSFKFTDFNDFEEKIQKLDYSKLKTKTFKVECERIGKHDFSSADVWPTLGEFVKEKYDSKVAMKDPNFYLQVYIYNDKAYVGLNYVGFEIDKRDYKVYQHRNSIKGPLAYTLLKLGKYSGKEILLDPFPHAGSVPIEAAFIKSKFSINNFRKDKFKFLKDELVDESYLKSLDKKIEKTKEGKKAEKAIFGFDSELRNIKSMKSNAKIGGVQDLIEFSKIDAEWIDLKFEKESVDLIVSNIPAPGRRTENIMPRKYKEMFYNANYALKKKGTIVSITNKKLRLVAEKEGFKVEKTIELKKGERKIEIDLFCKE